MRWSARSLATAAVLAGALADRDREWGADAPQPALAALGARRDPLTGVRPVPGEPMLRRALGCLDGDAVDAAVVARGWPTDGDHRAGPRVLIG